MATVAWLSVSLKSSLLSLGCPRIRRDLQCLYDSGASENMERETDAFEPARRRTPENPRVLLEGSRCPTQPTQDVVGRRQHIRIRQRHAGPYPLDILV